MLLATFYLWFVVEFAEVAIIRDVEAVILQTLPLPHLSLPLPPLPLPPTKNEKTIVDNFLNFCGSVACLFLHFIILRGQKPSFIAITLPTSLELIVANYSVFFYLDIRSRVECRTVLSFDWVTSSDFLPLSDFDIPTLLQGSSGSRS